MSYIYDDRRHAEILMMDRSGSGSMLIERSHRHGGHDTSVPYTRGDFGFYRCASSSGLIGCNRRILNAPVSSRKLQTDVDKVGLGGNEKSISQQRQPQMTSVCSRLIHTTSSIKKGCNLLCGLTPLQQTPCLIDKLANENTSGNVRGIFKDQLVQLIQSYPKSILILDCRSFISRSAGHILGSVGVNCTDPISRKRLLRGNSNIVDFVLGQDAKKMFKSRVQTCSIIVYDDDTTNIESLATSTSLKIVVSCLQRQNRSLCYLQGGFRKFRDHYPSLCVQQKSLAVTQSFTDSCDAVDSAPCSQITPFLFVGNEEDSSDRELLNQLGITHVINATSHLPSCFEQDGIAYKRISITDGVNQDIRQHFYDAIHFIDSAAQSNGKVLVHCQAGVSRSPTIAIAYIMAHSQLTMLDAFQFVKNKRNIIAPNLSFMGQLMSFEEDLKRNAPNTDTGSSESV